MQSAYISFIHTITTKAAAIRPTRPILIGQHQAKMSQLVVVSPSITSLAATLLLLLLSAAAAGAPAATTTTTTTPTPTSQAQAAGAACHNDIVALRTTCYEYVQEGGPRLPPSSNCCATLMGLTNVPCVCDYISADLDVDVDKVLYVARHCGVTIPRACGDLNKV